MDRAQTPLLPTSTSRKRASLCRHCNRNAANGSKDPKRQVTRRRSTAASQQMANRSGTSQTEASTLGASVRKPTHPKETRGVGAKATVNAPYWPGSAASGSTTGASKCPLHTNGKQLGRRATHSPPRFTLEETDEDGLAFYAGQLSQMIRQEQAAMQDAWAQLSSEQRKSLSPPRNNLYGLPPCEITSDEEDAMAGRKQ